MTVLNTFDDFERFFVVSRWPITSFNHLLR